MVNETYECTTCKRTATFDREKNDIPYCCDEPMSRVPKEICTQPAHPEHPRPMEDEDACDDGRGNIK